MRLLPLAVVGALAGCLGVPGPLGTLDAYAACEFLHADGTPYGCYPDLGRLGPAEAPGQGACMFPAATSEDGALSLTVWQDPESESLRLSYDGPANATAAVAVLVGEGQERTFVLPASGGHRVLPDDAPRKGSLTVVAADAEVTAGPAYLDDAPVDVTLDYYPDPTPAGPMWAILKVGAPRHTYFFAGPDFQPGDPSEWTGGWELGVEDLEIRFVHRAARVDYAAPDSCGGGPLPVALPALAT